MKTEYLKLDLSKHLNAQLMPAAEIIKRGGLVVFPTETVYGLGASALDADASQKIYAAKGRPSDNPLIIHISSPKEAEKYCVTNEKYYLLAEKFLPGPLTVIMPKKEIIPKTVTGGLDTVAVRCPENEAARALIRLSGVPIAAPSANISGKPSPTSAAHVKEDLDGKVDMIVDGGECRIGLESTIVKLDCDGATLLRPGAITPEMLEEVLGKIKLDGGITKKNETDAAPLAPGMKYKHYAPRAQVYLLKGKRGKIKEFIKEKIAEDKLTGVLCFDELADEVGGEYTFRFGRADDGASHAKLLFKALRYFDETGVNRIYATAVGTDGIDLATYNRMLKASGYTIIEIE